MEFPEITPTINDNSKIDESVNANAEGDGRVLINQIGIQRLPKFNWTFVAILLIGGFLVYGRCNDGINTRIDTKIDSLHKDISSEIGQVQKKLDIALQESKNEVALAKDTSIWILRQDILRTIEMHETRKSITQQQYKWLKEQFDHYKAIGGNHDVQGKFDDFNMKIFGTKEISLHQDGKIGR